MMASSNFLKDLEENFFLCPVCLEQFKEPKFLPCLHRYCSDCLRKFVNRSNDGKITCSMCTQQCTIPDNGIEGFKTDFHMKSVVDFIQLQKESENENIKECVSCSKKKRVSAYCLKCKDFLCEQCYNVHITNKMFTDHKSRTLELKNTDGKKMAMGKLPAVTENDQCSNHVEEKAKLCCSTCANEPICVICAYKKHNGHDLHDVTELSNTERELLEVKIAELNKLRSKLYELPKNVEATKQKLRENVSKKKDLLINQHKHEIIRIKQKLDECRNERLHGIADIEKRKEEEESQTKLRYDEEMNKLNKNYQEIRKTTEIKYNNKMQCFVDSCDNTEDQLVSKLESLNVHLRNLTESTDFLAERHENELQKISDDCDHVIARYENVTALSSSILAIKDEWAQVQCIPDIRASCEHLIEETNRAYPVVDYFSDISFVSDIPDLLTGNVTISAQEPTVVYINGFEAIGGRILGMKSNRNGDIVISGPVSKEYSHITVINTKGEIKQHDQIQKGRENDVYVGRYCCYLSDFKVATVCRPDEIGIYDVRDGLYTRKYISDCISDWSADGLVYYVGNVPLRNQIIVGTNSRCLYAFDYQLNYIHTIMLPDVISRVNDINPHKDTFVICDHEGERAFALSMDESESTLLYELTKPELDGSNVRPLRVCVDKNDFIYMLWRVDASFETRCNVVQYSQDGRKLLTTRQVADNAIGLVIADEGDAEKLLIATSNSGKICEYALTI